MLLTSLNDRPVAPGEDLLRLREELKAAEKLSVAQVEKAYRRIRAAPDDAEVKVAWLANHTIEPAVRNAAVAALLRDVVVADYIGPFDQYFQAILDETSELAQFSPQVIVLWLSLRALAPELVEGGAGRSEDIRRQQADDVLERLAQWIAAARERTNATLLIANFPRPPLSPFGIADARSTAGDAALYAMLNGRLAETYRADPRVMVLDVDHAISRAGSASGWNPRMYRLAKIEWDGAAANTAGELFARAIRTLVRPPRKCLAIDLDNTLWGGVVGEDGPRGIRVAEGDPVGESFLAFQRALLDLKARGVLLAVCSKNNPEDVEEAFASQRMPLALDDFAAIRINWTNKPENLRDIARELNIGIDSLALVDDSPAECELVRQLLPEVCTIQLPGDPAEFADYLLSQWDFDKLVVTVEDARKTEQYRENTARESMRASAGDLSAFLKGLGTRLRIAPAGQDNLLRLHQLLSKTNQFNVTTKRYTPSEVEEFAESSEWRFEYVHAEDNFGDLGIIGLYLLFVGGDEPEVDSFLLSCRAMGRGIESAMCNRLKHIAFDELAAPALRAHFVPTRKNKPAVDFYDSQGFSILSEEPDGSKIYRLQRELSRETPCPGLESVDVEV